MSNLSTPSIQPSIQVAIKLNPIFELDQKTGYQTVYFEGFPQAIAYDVDQKSALLRLIEMFQVMLRDNKERLLEEIMRTQIKENIPNVDVKITE